MNKWDDVLEKVLSLLWWFLVASMAVGFVVLFVYLIPQAIQRDSKAKDLTEAGCKYIGHARDLNTVYFYDCNGEIKMKRVK